MLRAVIVLLALATLASAYRLGDKILQSSIIDEVNNNPSAKWKAGVNKRFEGYSVAEFLPLLGARRSIKHRLPAFYTSGKTNDIPTAFDSRTGWPKCTDIIGFIRDQGECGSCWAFGAIEAMSDRFCIGSAGSVKVQLAAEDLTSCSDAGSCDGGWPESAWDYMQSEGVVTEDCYPYELPPCQHPCGKVLPTPPCNKTCANGAQWSADKHYAKSVYSVSSDADAIAKEIMTNGPVEAAFDVYEDFVNYKSGVYHHVSGSMLGGHAIKILGWGVDGTTPYWLVANSWNTSWGDKGYFKILRGSDECGIESDVCAGLAKV